MILEATIKQQPLPNALKVFPAFMTFDEYLKIANPRNKFHSSEAYDWNVDQMNKYKSERGQKYITKTLNGRRFTFYVRTIDKTDSKYYKRDTDGTPLRVDGELQYFSKGELVDMFNDNRYSYEVTVIDDQTDMRVGTAQDEWGALLIATASEYRGFGIGTIVGTIIRKLVPDYDSGGLTNAGKNNLHRVYSKFVQDAMAEGLYTKEIRAGKLTTAKVKEIIASADLKKPVEKKETKNMNPLDPEDMLLMQYENAFVLYNKHLLEMWNDDSVDDYWKDKFILGMSYASSGPVGSNNLILFQFGGENDTIKKLMMSLALSDAQVNGENVRIKKDQAKFVDFPDDEAKYTWTEPVKYLFPVQRDEELIQPLAYENVLKKHQSQFRKEKTYRKLRDKYGEFENWILETATQKYD